jgi:F0F1-type ATP synthase assembly protein I
MAPGPYDSNDLGRYMAMGQIGMEMAGPIVIGALLDYWLGCQPWLTVIGACLGLVFGLVVLIRMATKGKKDRADKKSESP